MFSVILPAYNSAQYLDQAIQSVMSQRVQDWELIVVDDGSIDGTEEVLKAYRDHPQVRCFRQENQGASAARNHGMALARGSHLAFLDADDLWQENHLEVMRELIGRYPDAGLYGTFTRTELVNGRTLTTCPYFQTHPQTVYLKDFFQEYRQDKSVKMFTVITTCVSREAYEKVGGFPVGCRIGEDLEFSLRVAAYFPVVLTSRITATYRKANSQATKQDSFDPDWSFFDTVEQLYRDPEIPPEKEANLKAVMDWFTIRRSRHYLIQGERKKARETLDQLGKVPELKRDKLLTQLLWCLPTGVTQKIFELRWRGKA